MSPLNTFQLEALEAVARLRNFTLAAKELRLTQPALTRRVQALESQLNTALFVRSPTGLNLTDAGEKVLRFAQASRSLEKDLLGELADERNLELEGTIRIAGYSSILHLGITPALGPLLRANPKVQTHYIATQSFQRRQLELLSRAEADFLIGFEDHGNRELISHHLGWQEMVAVESAKFPTRKNSYLDARPEDLSTAQFLSVQSKKEPPYQRSFLYDEEGILSAVAQGWGRGVVFSSLAKQEPKVRVVKGMKPQRHKIFLTYRKQPYYPRLMEVFKGALLKNVSRYLG
jgi:DNA-binding transcriptional LysR family regulator